MADVTYNTIIKIKFGGSQNPTIDTLSKIAKALGVSVDELMNFSLGLTPGVSYTTSFARPSKAWEPLHLTSLRSEIFTGC
jgi:transcriptional regulator with XRE-family HTH domain